VRARSGGKIDRVAAALRLPAILDRLEAFHGPPADVAPRDPFGMVLWENVAYLVPDERRREAFAELGKRVGTTAEKVRAARPEVLLAIARKGGMHPEQRAERLLRCAEIALSRFGGDLRRALALQPREARRALRLFPGIGEPGAEKILLFTATEPVLALESNGLRVLLRLGYGEQAKNYAATYRSVQAAADRELVRDCAWLQRAHLLLRAHGQRLCKSSHPECDACPMEASCAFARA
jgi:endonuclease-3